ncbi:MAG: putative glycerol-3-phosphate acyltransferase [Gammaproteobacteria bacterium]|nr:MAG: putative glycerol-3-phosphate acyltransferase [Gammaproteobacteria bacterium]|tara:strand:+ start:4955 stop:5548 length:594 start_codon:yes stop_codon:yes gene_type:complete
MLENMLIIDMLVVSLILYIIGSIPFAVIISALFRLPDPRSFGSNNPGATNVMRSGNKYAGIFTLIGDALKGYIPVYVLLTMGFENYETYLLSFLILIGHTFPIFLKFKGGKGVATSLGILLSLNILIGLFFIVIWLFMYYLFKISGVSALVGFLFLPLYFFLLNENSYMTAISFLNLVFIFLTHKSNIICFLTNKPR